MSIEQDRTSGSNRDGTYFCDLVVDNIFFPQQHVFLWPVNILAQAKMLWCLKVETKKESKVLNTYAVAFTVMKQIIVPAKGCIQVL